MVRLTSLLRACVFPAAVRLPCSSKHPTLPPATWSANFCDPRTRVSEPSLGILRLWECWAMGLCGCKAFWQQGYEATGLSGYRAVRL